MKKRNVTFPLYDFSLEIWHTTFITHFSHAQNVS